MEAVITQEDLRPVLASNITRLRRQRGLTQEQLAQRIGVSRVMLNRIEAEKSSPGAELLFSLADALGVTADNLRQVPIDAV
jgi:transcriptional regulator with XRE-family HTH domain